MMTKNETAKILAVLNAYYPDVELDPATTVNAWYKLLQDYDYEVVEQAAMNFAGMDKRDYPKFPSIGQIKAQMDMLCKKENTPEELWNKVYKAICGNPDRAKEAFDNLPKCCQRWLNNPNQIRELGMTDITTVNTVVRGQFLKTIGEIQEQEEAQAQLPENVRKALGALQIGE